MRTLPTATITALGMAGCAPSVDHSANAQPPASQPRTATPAPTPAAAKSKSASQAPPKPASTPHATTMSREEIAAYVRAVVSVELSKLNPAEGAPDDGKSAPADSDSNPAGNEDAAAAENRARDQTGETARETSEQERLVAQYLLSPDELKRVDEIRDRLKDGTIWGLPYQDLEFAAAGLATPLLRDELLAAAARTDDTIEIDVWANRARLRRSRKSNLRSFRPKSAQRILSFLDGAAKGQPADPEPRIREYVYRYPFMRKLLATALLASKQSQ